MSHLYLHCSYFFVTFVFKSHHLCTFPHGLFCLFLLDHTSDYCYTKWHFFLFTNNITDLFFSQISWDLFVLGIVSIFFYCLCSDLFHDDHSANVV